jgi:hypothetical protein
MAMELRESVAGFTLPDGTVSKTGTHGAIGDDELPVVTDTVAGFGAEENSEEHEYVATLDDAVDLQSSEFDEDIHFSVEDDPDNLDLDGDKKSGVTV